jgi:hypothetical protein
LPIAARPKAKLSIGCYSSRNSFNYTGGISVNTKPVGGSSVNKKSISGRWVISKDFGGNPVNCRKKNHSRTNKHCNACTLLEFVVHL